MLSKSLNKYIRSLGQQKFRLQYKSFVVEGDTIAQEWLASDQEIEYVIAQAEWLQENEILVSKHKEAEKIEVKEHELQAVSGLKTANKVLLVVKMPALKQYKLANKWYLALDDISDPGNMGTIIRIADWFGIDQIFCSTNCVDIYNAKVVQAAMGSHLRVSIHYCNLTEVLSATGLPIYATTLQGDNIYTLNTNNKGIIIIGNESKGISDALLALATRQILIPRKGGAESLNAAISAGIVCALLIQ